MRTLRETIQEIADKHDGRMKNDPRYRQTYFLMQEATKAVEPARIPRWRRRRSGLPYGSVENSYRREAVKCRLSTG